MKREAEQQFYFGTKDQFSDFFRKNYRIGCLIALKYVKDSAVAEDLVQDVLVTLWERKETSAQFTNLRNYFFTSVKNHALNLIQRNKNSTTLFSEFRADLPDEDNSAAYSQEELAVKVYHAIQELPTACQRIFRLAYEQNYSYQEIADTLNISKNTVKTQMGIAYKQLRLKLIHLVVTLLSCFQKI